MRRNCEFEDSQEDGAANFTRRRLRLEATICTQIFDTQTFLTTQKQMTEKRGGVVCVGSLNIDLFCYLHDQFPKPGKSRPPHPLSSCSASFLCV